MPGAMLSSGWFKRGARPAGLAAVKGEVVCQGRRVYERRAALNSQNLCRFESTGVADS